MAKQRANRGTGGRGGGRSATGRRSSSANSGQTLAALIALVAVLAGGTYLYRHTTASPEAAGIASSADPSAPPSSVRNSVPPSGPAISHAPHSLTEAQTHPPPGSPLTTVPASSPRSAPFGTSEEVFEGGARLYAANCAGCHGRPGQNARGPAAAQFWDHSNAAGSQATARPVGILYEAIAKGNVVQGMPSYGQRLTDTQLWDLALLLKSAREDLPEPVLRLLHGAR